MWIRVVLGEIFRNFHVAIIALEESDGCSILGRNDDNRLLSEQILVVIYDSIHANQSRTGAAMCLNDLRKVEVSHHINAILGEDKGASDMIPLIAVNRDCHIRRQLSRWVHCAIQLDLVTFDLQHRVSEVIVLRDNIVVTNEFSPKLPNNGIEPATAGQNCRCDDGEYKKYYYISFSWTFLLFLLFYLP